MLLKNRSPEYRVTWRPTIAQYIFPILTCHSEMSQFDISAMKTRLYQWKLHLKLVVCNIGRTEKASSIFLHATNNNLNKNKT
jgi:hypothetical protein